MYWSQTKGLEARAWVESEAKGRLEIRVWVESPGRVDWLERIHRGEPLALRELGLAAESRLIRLTLAEAEGEDAMRLTETASRLGVASQTLQQRMQALGLT